MCNGGLLGANNPIIDATLWYVLAAANALSGDSGLIAGTQLKVPEVGVSKNDSGTFKPYNPNEIVGSTSPSLPFIPPPNGCNSFAVVLTSAILFIAAPYLLPVISSVGGFAGAVIVGAATFTANAVATAVGSVIGANSFSWRASVREGVIAGLTFGLGKLDVLAKLGPISRVIQSSEFTKVAAQAVLNKGIDIAASKATGLEHSAFSWKGIAIQAVTQKIVKPVMDRLSENVFNKIENPMQQRLIGELTGGLVTEAVSVGVRRSLGIEARFNLGAALGNAFAAAIRPDFLALSGKDEAGSFGLDAGKSTGSNFGGFIPSMGYGPHRAGAAYSDEDAAGVASVGLSAAEQSKVIDTVQVKGNRDGSTYVWNPSTQQWGYGNSVILDATSGKIVYSKPLDSYAQTRRKDGYSYQRQALSPVTTSRLASTLQTGSISSGYQPAEPISGFDPITNRRAWFNNRAKDTESGQYARDVFNPQDLLRTRNSNRTSGEIGLSLGENYGYLITPRSVGRLVESGVGENFIGYGVKGSIQGVYGSDAEYTAGEGVSARIGAAAETKISYVEGGAKGALGKLKYDAGSIATASADIQTTLKYNNGRLNTSLGFDVATEIVALRGTVNYQAPIFDFGLVEIQPGINLQGNLGGIGAKLEGGLYTLKNGQSIKIYGGAGLTPGIGGSARGSATITISPRVFDAYDYLRNEWKN